MNRSTHTYPRSTGFSLVETVIAVGIIATLLTAFAALLGIANDSLGDSFDRKDADRLVSALEREMTVLYPEEVTAEIKTAFDKAYKWIGDASKGSGTIFIYSYEGDPSVLRSNGTILPDADSTNRTVVVPVARFVQGGSISDDMREELDAIFGPVFCVKTRQLVYNEEGTLEEGEEGINPPREGMDSLPSGVGLSDSYPDAVILFKADFHILASNTADYLESFSSESLKRPIFSRSLSARR